MTTACPSETPMYTPWWRRDEDELAPPAVRDDLYERLRKAARVLGWSGPREGREASLRSLLDGGLLAVEAILDEATACPRAEVIDEASALLARFPVTPPLLNELAKALRADTAPVRRALAVRALGYLPAPPEKRLPLLERALADEDPEVRDRAALALGEVGGPHAKRILQAALRRELSALVRESIQDALAEIS